MSTAESAARPQYGNFRPTRRVGLFGVPLLALCGLLAAGGMGFAMLLGRQWVAATAWTVFVVAATAPLLRRNVHDRNLYQVLGSRLAFAAARRSGGTVYLAGGAGHTPDGSCRLPGLLAASRLSEHRDAYGQPFALLHVPATHHYSVVLEAQPSDHRLLDDEVVDQQVAMWGGWLADLGNHPSVEGASVTVESAPDSGLRLRRNITSQLSEDAPEFAAATLAEIAETFPATAAQVTTRITVTWSGIPSWQGGERVGLRRRAPRPRSTEQMAQEIGNLLPAVVNGLRATGAGTGVRAMRAQDVVDATRVAYDPRVALAVEEARSREGTGLRWEDAGPTGAVESWDSYRHDYGWSRTWYMSAPHRGSFPAEAMSRLLSPHRDIARKRVTILYRPEPPTRAAEIVDRAYLDATSQAAQRSRATARDRRAIRVAERTAEEEAAGASLLRFAVVVTATVLDPAHLPLASATVEGLAAAPRLRLRAAVGNQAAAFAAGLPLGLVLPRHLVLAPELRDQMM